MRVKPKQKIIIPLTAKMPKTGEEINFYLTSDKELIEKIPKEKIKIDLQTFLKEVSVTPVFGMNNIGMDYSFVDIPDIPDYGNVLVEVNIPYCLHIPNGHIFVVNLNDKKNSANVIMNKVWTTKAKGSSIVDMYSDKKTYFNKPIITTPQFPCSPESGWDLDYTGENIQKIKDDTGKFRYTRLSIFFDMEYEKQLIDNKGFDIVNNTLLPKTIEIINRVIDVYRHITKEEFVERLSFLNITNVYFIDTNQGFYPSCVNMEGAVMNISKQDIEEIDEVLFNDEKIPLYELLLLSSNTSFNKGLYALSVVETFQALEIFIELEISKSFKDKGFSEKDIEAKLNKDWRTKIRLSSLLKEAKGHSLSENKVLWDGWCTIYDNVRNKVIHFGKEPTIDEAKSVAKTNADIISWIKNII